jgi:hypothetical protein
VRPGHGYVEELSNLSSNRSRTTEKSAVGSSRW